MVKRVFLRRWRRCRRHLGRVGSITIVLLSILGLLGVAFFRCRPIMTTFAESQAVWTATKIANQTVAQVLQEYAELCTETIVVTYDGEQNLSSVRTNTATINTVRTTITHQTIAAMEKVSSLAVGVPLGTLLGWDWCSGLGPLITFPVGFTATVVSDFSSSLIAEGINQSLYRVLIHLEISLYVVSPAGRSTVAVRVNYPMAETVLLGRVPDNLTEVYGDDQSMLGQIFDYGTMQ